VAEPTGTVPAVKACLGAIEVDPFAIVLVDAVVAGAVANPRQGSTVAQAVHGELVIGIDHCAVAAVEIEVSAVEVVSFVRVVAEPIADPCHVGA